MAVWLQGTPSPDHLPLYNKDPPLTDPATFQNSTMSWDPNIQTLVPKGGISQLIRNRHVLTEIFRNY